MPHDGLPANCWDPHHTAAVACSGIDDLLNGGGIVGAVGGGSGVGDIIAIRIHEYTLLCKLSKCNIASKGGFGDYSAQLCIAIP